MSLWCRSDHVPGAAVRVPGGTSRRRTGTDAADDDADGRRHRQRRRPGLRASADVRRGGGACSPSADVRPGTDVRNQSCRLPVVHLLVPEPAGVAADRALLRPVGCAAYDRLDERPAAQHPDQRRSFFPRRPR